MKSDWQPQDTLSKEETDRGLKLVIADGLMAEVMTTLTGGAFLTSLAILMGANNLQIGLLATLPLCANFFQLASIWLVRRFRNRKLVTVATTILARVPLLIIAALIFFTLNTGMHLMLIFLFIHYLLGSVAGPSWNSWMKDLIPEDRLGSYFAKRGSYMQALNVVLSIAGALAVDHIRRQYPQYEYIAYAVMFLLAGMAGLYGTRLLAAVKEPRPLFTKENIFRMLKKPLRDQNFKRLLFFNCAWVFALNLATPFFTVFMLHTMKLSLSYITMLLVLSQLASIFSIRVWGAFADRYSNKTILAILSPLYLFCLLGWCFVGIYSQQWANLVLLGLIHIVSGMANSGINLSLTNIGLKLAPKNDAIVYLSARNICTAVFAAVSPLIGGYLADYFNDRQLLINGQWTGPAFLKTVKILSLHQYNFLFLIAAVLGFISLELLVAVYEKGEVNKTAVVRVLRSTVRNNLKETFLIGNIVDIHFRFWGAIKRRRRSRRKWLLAQQKQTPS